MATIEAPLALRVEELRALERVLEVHGYEVLSRAGLTLVAQSKPGPPHSLQVRALLTTTRFTFERPELDELPMADWMRGRVAELLRHQRGVCDVCLTTGVGGRCPTCGLPL